LSVILTNLSHTMQTTYEYEERAFLTEEAFCRVKKELNKVADSREVDNKTSYFFVLPGKNLSLALSNKKAVIKYKSGEVGVGNGFEEYEIPVLKENFSELVEFFKHLLATNPQFSEQFRINYKLSGNIEVALKYTETWGFHLEIEKVYFKNNKIEAAKEEINKLASSLKINLLTEEEIIDFRRGIDSGGEHRGAYSSEDFKVRFGREFI